MPIASKSTDQAIFNDVDPEVSQIKAKTDNLPTDPADESLLEAAITAAAAGGATVPAADSVDNVNSRDVVGNKTDTVAGNSLVSIGKQIYARQGAPAGASQSADVAAVKVDTAAIKLETDQIGTIVNTGGTATVGGVIGDVANSSLVARIGAGAAQATVLGAAVGVSISADIAAVKAAVDVIDDFVDTEVAAIKVETDQIGTVINTGGTATLSGVIGDVANSSLVTRIGVGAAQASVLGAAVGASISADIAAVKAAVDAVDDFVDTEVAAIKAKTDNLPTDPADASDILSQLSGGVDAVNRVRGNVQFITTAVTSAANAGDVTMATVTTQPCFLESVVVHSDGATTADLTSITIKCGAAKVVTIIDSTLGAKANIDAQDEQVAYTGAIYLPTGATVVMTLAGTGATAVDLNTVIKYRSCVNGGYLA